MGKIKHRSREDIKLQQLPGMPRNLFRWLHGWGFMYNDEYKRYIK